MTDISPTIEISKADLDRLQKWEAFGQAITNGWPATDVDGFEMFEAALESGLVVEIPGGYNPEHHIDEYGISPEPGDPWYRWAF